MRGRSARTSTVHAKDIFTDLHHQHFLASRRSCKWAGPRGPRTENDISMAEEGNPPTKRSGGKTELLGSNKRLKLQCSPAKQLLSIPLQECAPEQVEVLLLQENISKDVAKLIKGMWMSCAS